MRAHENPFRVDRVDSLAFEPQDTTWPALLEHLTALDFRAAIVGPHGSGKSTLLRDLGPRLRAAGRLPRYAFLNRDAPRPGLRALGALGASLSPREILLFDGACHLPMPHWRTLRRAARGAGGLVITAHHEGRLPTLLRTHTSPTLLRRLASQLSPDARLLPAEALHAAHDGNLRDVFRALYDACGRGACG